MGQLLLLFLSVIVASAFCSMAEAALLSISISRVRMMHEQKTHRSGDLLFLKENMDLTIATVVIVNNAINIIGAIFIGQKAADFFGSQWLGLASAVLTITIIIAAEIIPKTIGERYRIKLSIVLARPIRILIWVLQPMVKTLMALIRPFIKGRHLPTKISEDEIRLLLKLGRDEGTVEMDEEMLCNRIFKLNDIRAFQIMKPLEKIFSLPADHTLGELREDIIRAPYSRIVVYDKEPRHIVGTVQQRVLLREIAQDNYDAYLRDFINDPIFVNWFTKADALLEKFKIHNQHLFIAQDMDNNIVGMVTMEDVFEELFGEIYDEKDSRVIAGAQQRLS